MKYWVLRGRPDVNDFDEMLKPGTSGYWTTARIPKDLTPGDRIFIWESSPSRSVVGLAERGNGKEYVDENGDPRFEIQYLTHRLFYQASIDELRQIPILGEASFLKAGPATALLALTTQQAEILFRYVYARNPNLGEIWVDIQPDPNSEIAQNAENTPGLITHTHMESLSLISIENFEHVLRNDVLSESQLRALQALYNFPDHSATAAQLAAVLEYKGFGGANFAIGGAGKSIANELGVHPQQQRPDGEPAWFTIVAGGEPTTSGYLWIMLPELASALERTNLIEPEIGVELLPDEESATSKHEEGVRLRVEVNIYERSSAARKKCVAHYGAKCAACGFDFESAYGNIGKGFIHVHHIVPLSEMNQSYIVDHIRDLRPVCPNCHAMIHRRTPAFSIEEIRSALGTNGDNSAR